MTRRRSTRAEDSLYVLRSSRAKPRDVRPAVCERVSSSTLGIEACPERLPWQAVEGLDTNGGWEGSGVSLAPRSPPA